MKLTTSKLKNLIKQQIISENQKALGIPHGVDLKENPEVLYDAAMSFIMKNPDLGPNSPNHEDAQLLLKILTNTIQGSVTNYEYGKGDMGLFYDGDIEGFIASKGSETTPEETEQMLDAQGKLKIVKAVLANIMGEVYADNGYKSSQEDKRDFFRNNPGYKPGDRDLHEAKLDPRGLSESLMFEGDDSIMEAFRGATLEDGGLVCEACLFEMLQEASCGCPNLLGEAVYQGKKVTLNKPTRGDVKKFKVYVNSGKKDSKGRVKAKKVNFGDKKMKIKKNNPKRRKSFRARHNCKNPGPKTKARYWSCKKW